MHYLAVVFVEDTIREFWFNSQDYMFYVDYVLHELKAKLICLQLSNGKIIVLPKYELIKKGKCTKRLYKRHFCIHYLRIAVY